MDFSYAKLLSRSKEKIPEVKTQENRFKLPPISLMFEGNSTIIKNFSEIVEAMNRKPEHLMRFLLKEFGTAGEFNRYAKFQRIASRRLIEEKIDEYLLKYVRCPECKGFDTRLVSMEKIQMIRCDACGAQTTVGSRVPKIREERMREKRKATVPRITMVAPEGMSSQ